MHEFINLDEGKGKKLDDYIFRKWYNLKTKCLRDFPKILVKKPV